jgi:hypothetical protein
VSEPWDPDKDRRNLAKHGVPFREAMTVIDNPAVLILEDVAHSNQEPRWTFVGVSSAGRILRVTVTPRGATLRPISARRASKRERHAYRSRTR